jgi:hypothetical protein
MGFFIIELLRAEDKSKLRNLMPKDYKFPKIKRGKIVIDEEVFKQLAQEEFDFYNKLMRKKPVAKG